MNTEGWDMVATVERSGEPDSFTLRRGSDGAYRLDGQVVQIRDVPGGVEIAALGETKYDEG